MIEKFSEVIKKIDPDIITGWNLIDFDLKVIKEKFEQYGLSERAYRALKQQDKVDPAEILAKLKKHGESLKGAGADRVRDTLLGQPVV